MTTEKISESHGFQTIKRKPLTIKKKYSEEKYEVIWIIETTKQDCWSYKRKNG